MALSIEDILLGTDNELASPERAAALAGALKNERRYGVLGQLMNLEPTRAVGQQLVGRADDALKLGVSRQESALNRTVQAENQKLQREWQQQQYTDSSDLRERQFQLSQEIAGDRRDIAAERTELQRATLEEKQLAADEKAAKNRQAAQSRATEIAPGVLRDINRAMELAEHSGGMRGVAARRATNEELGLIPEMIAMRTPGLREAYQLAQHLRSLKSNISIDALQKMRDASPTGGALGQIPVQQQKFLMEVQGNLDPTLPPDVLRENLGFVANNYLQLIADVTYGTDAELEFAVRRQKITPEQAAESRAMREAMMAEQSYDTGFGNLGHRNPELPQGPETAPGGAPTMLRYDAQGRRIP